MIRKMLVAFGAMLLLLVGGCAPNTHGNRGNGNGVPRPTPASFNPGAAPTLAPGTQVTDLTPPCGVTPHSLRVALRRRIGVTAAEGLTLEGAWVGSLNRPNFHRNPCVGVWMVRLWDNTTRLIYFRDFPEAPQAPPSVWVLTRAENTRGHAEIWTSRMGFVNLQFMVPPRRDQDLLFQTFRPPGAGFQGAFSGNEVLAPSL